MRSYQLKLYVAFFNILIYGDISLEDDQQKLQYQYYDLRKVGVPGNIMIGTSLSSLAVVTNNSESDDSEMLRKVELIVDEDAERRDDAFFEKVMPIGAEGLLTIDVVESDLLPIVNNDEVYIPIPWVGPSTIQLIAPDGFYRDLEGAYLVESLRVIVSPEIPQP